MNPRGVWTVARLELTQRARTSRWPVVLGIWFVVVGGVTTTTYYATRDPQIRSGRTMYDLTTFFVLGLAMLIVPALTATSINGDREQGVLATLQTTLLKPADIVLGKLLASWLVALVFLATTLPFLAWGFAVGGVTLAVIVRSMLVLVIVLAVVCALGLMFSTLTARPVGSAVLTYIVVAWLALGCVITFFLALPLVTRDEPVRFFGIPDSWWEQNQKGDNPPQPRLSDCEHLTRISPVAHTEGIWWLLAVNPFVVVADAGPGPEFDLSNRDQSVAIMREISRNVRLAKVGPLGGEQNECWFGEGDSPGPTPADSQRLRSTGPVWPLGLGVLVVAGLGATAIAIKRTTTPIRRLPNGTRIA